MKARVKLFGQRASESQAVLGRGREIDRREDALKVDGRPVRRASAFALRAEVGWQFIHNASANETLFHKRCGGLPNLGGC